jgi:hypothetical protein
VREGVNTPDGSVEPAIPAEYCCIIEIGGVVATSGRAQMQQRVYASRTYSITLSEQVTSGAASLYFN